MRYRCSTAANTLSCISVQSAAETRLNEHVCQNVVLQMKRAKEQVTKQLARVEADIQRILTHILKADVPGSGIEPEFIQNMTRALWYGLPGSVLTVFLLRQVFRRRRRKESPPTQSSSKSSTARRPPTSKSSKRKQSK